MVLATESGLEVEVFDKDALVELGCGGLLGVNMGSDEPPRMIKLTYRPAGADGSPATPTGHLALVGKGIMYDAGGISLKPSDAMHCGDEAGHVGRGGGPRLDAHAARPGLPRPTVTGYLMCTDNMPSGKAMRLGDVLTIRGGMTVEVFNTDAEGRLVMADALVLATELDPPPDAIVTIATLTGAALRTFGTALAATLGNDPASSTRSRPPARGPTSRSGSCRWSSATGASSTRPSRTSRTSAARTPARSPPGSSSRSSPATSRSATSTSAGR